MTPEAFGRIESLFQAATAHPPERRAQFLRDSEPDPAIRALVERLLESEAVDPTNPFSERLANLLHSMPSVPPHAIGPYRLVRELGAGGMGTVFLAERDVEGVAQQVALKLLHGLATEASRRRLALERSLLAGLNHPQIAGHVDGGETADGQPYLVMEYVEGVPLAQYLATAAPDLPARLRLFLELCDAVAHAHQRLVLHRDLKPSNVIVRADGTPVLVDFGVGKLLQEGASGAHANTATRVFTPGYGAPEQRRGEAATTATDVFGLGAVLFDLLADRRLPTLRPDDAPVPLPSRYVIDPGRRRAVRGDLDRIVGKATAEVPAERYPTVGALAEDVGRYLAGRPILAAPPTLAYRARKFVTRHRWAVAAALLVLALAGLFVWRLEAERQRALAAERMAAREATNASASRDFLVSVLAEVAPENARGQPITAASLLASAVRKLQAGTRQDGRARASAWLAIGDVYTAINDPKAALRAADAALASLDTEPVDLDLHARAFRVRGSALAHLERHDEAREALGRVIRLRERQGADPIALSRAYHDYGGAAMRRGDLDAADESLRRALELLDSAVRPEPERLRVEILFGLFSTHLSARHLDRAHEYLAETEAVARTTVDADDVTWYFLHLGSAQLNRMRGDYRVAVRSGREAVRLADRLFGEASRRTAETELEHAALLNRMGQPRDAIRHLERGRTIMQDLKVGSMSLAIFDANLAVFHATFGDDQRAIELADSVLAVLPTTAATAQFRASAHTARGEALSRLGRAEDAHGDFEQALEFARSSMGEDTWQYGLAQTAFARACIRARRWSEAQGALDIAERISREQLDARHPDRIVLTHLWALLALEQGDVAAARESMAQALSQAEGGGLGAVPLARLKLTAARLALKENEPARARRLVQEALPVLREQLSPKAAELVQAEQLAQKVAS